MATEQVARFRGRFRIEPVRQPAEGSFAVSHLWVDEKLTRRRSTGRWYRISSPEGRPIFRVLTFDPTLRYVGSGRGSDDSDDSGGGDGEGGDGSKGGDAGNHPGDIAIDWAGWLVLTDYAEDTEQSLELEFRRARWWNYPQLAVTHPDPVSRVALQVTAVAFVLGAVPFLAWLVERIAGLG